MATRWWFLLTLRAVTCKPCHYVRYGGGTARCCCTQCGGGTTPFRFVGTMAPNAGAPDYRARRAFGLYARSTCVQRSLVHYLAPLMPACQITASRTLHACYVSPRRYAYVVPLLKRHGDGRFKRCTAAHLPCARTAIPHRATPCSAS